MNSRRAISGFTLIELVVAMVISAILVGFVAMLVSTPVDAYIDQSERAEIAQSAETISRFLGRDLGEGVLPNSVRISDDGSTIEMLKVAAISSYVPAGAYEAMLPPQSARPATELAFNVGGEIFHLFGQVGSADKNFLVIGHKGSPGADAYELDDVIASDFTVSPDPSGEAGNYEIELLGTDAFTTPDSLQRVFWVSEPVTYMCNVSNRTLHRFSGYEINPSIATSEASSHLSTGHSALVADKIDSCAFSCGSGGPPSVCQDWVRLEATVVRATSAGNESIRILEQYAVDNPP
jgi:MSHA biogenesis protein MshO